MTDAPLSPDTQRRYNPVHTGFWEKYAGLMIQLSLFAGLMVTLVLIEPAFLEPKQWLMILIQSAPNAIMALALVIITRLKGIDLSAGAIFAASGWAVARFASDGKAVPGLLSALAVALAVGLAVGMVNGTIQMFIRIPSAPGTMAVSAAISFGILMLVVWTVGFLWDGGIIVMQISGADASLISAALFIAALLIVLALLYFTKLGESGQVQKRHVFMAYAGSGLLFSLAACCIVARVQMIIPNISTWAQTSYLLFIAATLFISRSTKTRILPVACVLMAALNWNTLYMTLALGGVNPYYQSVLQLLLAIALLVPAFIVQRKCRSRI